MALLMRRRSFLFAAPAIVAASSLMPISTAALIVPLMFYLVRGKDHEGRDVSEVILSGRGITSQTDGCFATITEIAIGLTHDERLASSSSKPRNITWT